MNREEIVREADSWLRMNGIGSDGQTCFMMALFAQHVSALVAAAEREACARVCEALANDPEVEEMAYRALREADEAIRARGQEDKT